ncbi:hypothetical protein AT847_000308 [Escherichia coli]|nr:hypothetical protein [Escherichia coli]MBV4687544.1 hypothetical protein [Escherichia coli]
MKIILTSESGRWFWILRAAERELARSEGFHSFVDARAHAELFRIGARSPVILRSVKKCAQSLVNDKYHLVFLVTESTSGFCLSLSYPENIHLYDEVFESFEGAESFAQHLSYDVFELADIYDCWGSLIHPLQHSRFYRNVFDIDDDHPSAW